MQKVLLSPASTLLPLFKAPGHVSRTTYICRKKIESIPFSTWFDGIAGYKADG
jgi:hypothetical protein